jgi:hypothetical protein
MYAPFTVSPNAPNLILSKICNDSNYFIAHLVAGCQFFPASCRQTLYELRWATQTGLALSGLLKNENKG